MQDGKIWDVAIIGSGPAGLTAAIYTIRGLASTIVFAGEKWGGQLMLTTTVDNFPGFPSGIEGQELMALMRKQAERFGAEFIEKNVTAVNFHESPFKLKTDVHEYFAKSVIIATGAETLWLGLPGEFELIGRGVSSCAPCDAPFFKNKKVVVVGGGDSAMEEALVLTKYASRVTIVHRRAEFRASKIMQDKVLNNSKIKILWNTEIKEICGAKKVEKVLLINNQTNKASEIAVDGIFVAIGHSPSTEIFKNQLELDAKGYIKRFENQHFSTVTSVAGVFVAGDVYDYRYKQAVTAAGLGCMAAMDALKFLDKAS